MSRTLRLACAALAVVAAPPAAADWREATSNHFVIYANDSEDYVRRFAERLERLDAAMRFLRGIPAETTAKSNRVTIFIPGGMAEVQKLCGKCPNIAGFYVPRAGGSVAYSPRASRDAGQFDLKAETVLFHEYAHHFMLERTSSPVPRWYTEGFAEFYASSVVERDGTIGVGRPAMHRAYGLTMARKLPLETVLNPPDKPMNLETMDVFYGRSWLLTHYLMLSPQRRGQLDTYLGLLAVGKLNLDAAREAFGDLKTLDKDLDRYLDARRTQYFRIPPTKISVGPIAVRTLSTGEAMMMPVRMRSARGVNRAAALALIPEARLRSAAFPNDAAAQGVLAEAEYDAGNDTEADAAASRALAANPKSMQALVYKGRVAMRRAEGAGGDKAVWTKVRRWFLDANAIDNDAAEPLMLYYQSFRAQGIAPTPNAVDALVMAFRLSPQDGGLRMMTAQQLLIDDRKKEARTALLPLAYDPHNRGGSNFAARLVEQIDAGTMSGKQIAGQRPGGADATTEDEP